jgi:hypothetical protein
VVLGWLQRFQARAEAGDAANAAAVSDEARQLGVDVTTSLFSRVNLGAAMAKQFGPELADAYNMLPEWPRLMQAAIAEELASGGSQTLARAGGVVMPRFYTVDELRAISAALHGPDGSALAVVVERGSLGEKVVATPALQRFTNRLARTPAGRSFMEKFANFGPAGTALGEEYGADLYLGIMHRFIDKALADWATQAPGG